MTLAEFNAAFGLAWGLFGVPYAIWGEGPDMPRVPHFWRAFARLFSAPIMLSLALLQKDATP